MNSLQFVILITVLSLNADFAFGLTDLHEFIEAVQNWKNQDDDSTEHFTNNSIMIVVPQTDSDESSNSYENNKQIFRKINLSDEISSENNITHYNNSIMIVVPQTDSKESGRSYENNKEIFRNINSSDETSREDNKVHYNSSTMIVVPQTDSKESGNSNENKKQIFRKINSSDEISNEDNTTHSIQKLILRTGSENTSETSTRRSIRQATTKKAGSALSEAKQRAHERRIREVSEHMAEHFMSTLYFYNEVKRIQKHHVVMDELRIMAVELEHPNNRWMRDGVLKCFRVHSRPVVRPIWNKKTNNLFINIVKDSINDGVLI